MMMTEVLYEWVFEVAVIMSGGFGVIEAGVTGVLINIILFCTPALTGIYIAVAIRISNTL